MSRVASLDELVARDKDHDCVGFGLAKVCVKVDAVAELPTRFGKFRIVAFWNNRDGKEHIALVHGDVMAEDVPLEGRGNAAYFERIRRASRTTGGPRASSTMSTPLSTT